MILIADSGATKTDWCLTNNLSTELLAQTSGINPFHQRHEDIHAIIEKQLLPQIDNQPDSIKQIFFYGSGCTPEKEAIILQVLSHFFPDAEIQAKSDLMGAARALCGHKAGIACILGTGSNSCLFDGEHIVQNTAPLGYILGDEGSGAVLGKKLVGDCLKHQLPDDLYQDFLNDYKLTPASILEKVYRQPLANRFLASLTPFLKKHEDRYEIKQMLSDCFQAFFIRNLNNYDSRHLPVHFVGSIAYYFEDHLREAALLCDYTIGNIIKSPIQALTKYHRILLNDTRQML